MNAKQCPVAAGCEKRASCRENCLRWADFQYLMARSYPGSVSPQKLRICFADPSQSQDVVIPRLLDCGRYVALAVTTVFGRTEFLEPMEFDMVATRENTAGKPRAEESADCGLTGCPTHGRCAGPQDCRPWRKLQYLIAHTSPAAVGEEELCITYHARAYSGFSNGLFTRQMGSLVACIQAIYEHFEDFASISVRLSG